MREAVSLLMSSEGRLSGSGRGAARLSLRHALSALTLSLSAASCEHTPVLLVEIQEWPAAASELRVSLWADGVVQAGRTIWRGEPSFPLARPVGKTVQILLEMLDEGGCRVANGGEELSPQPWLPLVHTIRPRFTQLPVPQCRLNLYLPSDRPLRRPASDWMVCSDYGTACVAEVPKGEQVQLSFDEKITGPKEFCYTDTSCLFRMDRSLTIGIEGDRESCRTRRTTGFCTALVSGRTNVLWGTGNAVLAFMEGGRILRWQEKNWVPHSSLPLTSVRAVWGSDGSSVWAVGSQLGRPSILVQSGDQWAETPSPATEAVNGIWGSSADNLWVIGDEGTVLRWERGAWRMQDRFTDESLQKIWGADASNIWTVGDRGSIFRWDGRSWSVEYRGRQPLYSLHGHDIRNIWAVGGRGTVVRYDGQRWVPELPKTDRDLYDVRVCSALSVRAVGQWGGTLQPGLMGWGFFSISAAQEFGSIWCDTTSSVWIASRSGPTFFSGPL